MSIVAHQSGTAAIEVCCLFEHAAFVWKTNCLIPPATLGNPVYTESVHWSKIQKENGINIQ